MEGRNCLDPEAAELLIHLPTAQMTPFMLDRAVPVLEELRARRRLRYWTFERGAYSVAKEPGILILARPARGAAAQALEGELRAALEPEVSRRSGKFFSKRPPALGDIDYMRSRYGGDRGVRIYSLFSRHSTALAFASLRCRHRVPEQVDQYELGLASFFFMTQILFWEPQEWRGGLADWTRWFATQFPEGNALRAACEAQAIQALEQNSELVQRLEAFSSTGWRAARAPLRALFERHERPLYRIGPLLRSNEPFYSPKYPRLFTSFHSYLHSHYLRIDMSAKGELFLMVLIQTWLAGRKEY